MQCFRFLGTFLHRDRFIRKTAESTRAPAALLILLSAHTELCNKLFLCILLFYRSTIGSVIENFEMSSSTTMFSVSMCVVVSSNVCILTEKKSNVTVYRCGAAAASSLTRLEPDPC